MKRSMPAILMVTATIFICGLSSAQTPSSGQPGAAPPAAPAGPPPLDLGDCPDSAGNFEIGKAYVCSCPPSAANGSAAGTVYGSLVYANDSNICSAALHAGALKTATAGRVVIHMMESPAVFKSSTQNGVKSEVWAAATPTAFEFTPTTTP